MCRNVKLRFVPKLSGFTKPSTANEPAFNMAVDAIAAHATKLLNNLNTNAQPIDREQKATKARARAHRRFA